MKLKIEYIPIEDLKTYANNAKIHTAEQIEQIKKSIQEFGMNDPIAVWKDNEIIEGHGRLIALKELGFTEAPIIRLDNLTDEERRAYALVHNKLTMNTGFDFAVLDMELEDLSFDMAEFGFDVGGDNSEAYVDDFFDRGVEANPVVPTYGCKVIVDTEEEQEKVMAFLKENGYDPKAL